jgi:putative glutamine amidotransferase
MTAVSEPLPLIGLSTYRQQATWGSWERRAAILQVAYVDCVAEAGGRPVMLPPADGPGASARSAELLAQRLDALVLVGGADVDPSRYGAQRDNATGAAHPWRDDNELALLGAFLESRRPVLGICRGTQILNSFLGGTLHQHLPDVTGSKDHQPLPGEFGEVRVLTEPGSVVASVMGEGFSVACSHHQAIDVLGTGLAVTARSEDGVIEAVELGSGFVVGVQWHPEQKADTRLFRALVEAC